MEEGRISFKIVNLEEKDLYEGLGIDDKKMLEWILKE